MLRVSAPRNSKGASSKVLCRRSLSAWSQSEQGTLWVDFGIAESENHEAAPHRRIAEIPGERDHVFVAGNNPFDLLPNLLGGFGFIVKSISLLPPKLKEFPINYG